MESIGLLEVLQIKQTGKTETNNRSRDKRKYELFRSSFDKRVRLIKSILPLHLVYYVTADGIEPVRDRIFVMHWVTISTSIMARIVRYRLKSRNPGHPAK